MIMTPSKATAAASLLSASATGQNVIFLPSILSSNEPPCRQRRLEPFRQNVRDACSVDVLRRCPLDSLRPSRGALALPPNPPDLFRMLDMPPPLSMGGQLDGAFDEMIGRSMALFDAVLAMDGVGVGAVPVRADSREEEVQRDAADPREERAERAAARALDAAASSPLADPEAEGRSARRLAEYALEVFYRPDGSVAARSSSVPSFGAPALGTGSEELDECLFSSYENGDLRPECSRAVEYFVEGSSTPGMAYESSTAEAVGRERASDRGSADAAVRASDRTLAAGDYEAAVTILLALYCTVAFVGVCIGLVDAWTFVVGTVLSVSVATLGLWSMFVLLPMMILVDRYFVEEESEEETEGEEGYDYVKLAEDEGEDEGDGEVKRAETMVFVGVPVQVV